MYDGPEVGDSGGWRWKVGWEWAAVGYDNNVDPSLERVREGVKEGYGCFVLLACFLAG
jgi:hypothetical protein